MSDKFSSQSNDSLSQEAKSSHFPAGQDDRVWLAMQYVLGELSSEDSDRFDEAMTADPSLCESVVEATRLVCGAAGVFTAGSPLRLASGVAADPVKTRFPRRAVSVCVGGICMAAALVFAVFLRTDPAVDRGGSLMSEEAATEAATQAALASIFPGEVEGEDSFGVSFVNENEHDAVSGDSLSDLLAPEWLLTAIDLEQTTEAGDSVDSSDVY